MNIRRYGVFSFRLLKLIWNTSFDPFYLSIFNIPISKSKKYFFFFNFFICATKGTRYSQKFYHKVVTQSNAHVTVQCGIMVLMSELDRPLGGGAAVQTWFL